MSEYIATARNATFWTLLGLVCLTWFLLSVDGAIHARSVGYGFSAKQALGFDFSVNVWRPAGQLLHGHGIYPAHLKRLSAATTADTPLLAVLASPLRLLPYAIALGVFEAMTFAAFVASLWFVGVRDWRVFAIAIGSAPVLSVFVCGQVTGLVALGYALAWRYRDRARVVGVVVGLIVALKLLAVPLIVWLALTGRRRAALVSTAAAVALVLVSWSVINFQGLMSYPHLLKLCGTAWARQSYSIKAAGLAIGLSGTESAALGLALAGLLGAWAVAAGLSGRDLASFAAASAAGIYLSPVVHMHYAMWLIVLVAIVQPRLHWIWLVVLTIWVSGTEPASSSWRLEAEVGVCLALITYAIAPRVWPMRFHGGTSCEVPAYSDLLGSNIG